MKNQSITFARNSMALGFLAISPTERKRLSQRRMEVIPVATLQKAKTPF